MTTLSDEQLLDISLAYSCDEIIDILGIESFELLRILREEVEENILSFNLRPVDAYRYDL
jgi:AraC-like DNA-binding protein